MMPRSSLPTTMVPTMPRWLVRYRSSSIPETRRATYRRDARRSSAPESRLLPEPPTGGAGLAPMVTTLRACATCAIATVALLVTGLFHTRAAPARPIEAGTGLIAHTEQTAHICHLIESSAATDGIPVDFFTRLIWQESSFRSHAVSPKGAQGIAQFMPTTAAERGLADPFDPEQAIPASARYLRELHDRLGNLGLAAAAYNAGPDRVR